MSTTRYRPSGRCLTIGLLLATLCAASVAALAIGQSDALDPGFAPVLAASTAEDHGPPPQVRGPNGDDDDDDGKKSKIIRGHLVQPLGWLAALLMVSASLYYSAKRSVLAAVQAAEGPQRRLIGTELRRALDRHIAASLAAVGLAILHVLNFFQRAGLTWGWVTLALMVGVATSGVLGRFLLTAPGIRRNWRRFHLPLTYVFFAVLAVHVFQAIELLED